MVILPVTIQNPGQCSQKVLHKMLADEKQYATGCPARPDVALIPDIIVENSDPIEPILQGTRVSGRSWMLHEMLGDGLWVWEQHDRVVQDVSSNPPTERNGYSWELEDSPVNNMECPGVILNVGSPSGS
ncbi:hypothetical protein AJ78_07393 [Emergomyces pasteurianus Ep9510]|uniref:Uncharacterized protein n=1 Tax=Emergomyces pasteurianus Ep9510 TaxID=1447872 RepID=A0A1J9P693_9EURO|nr:hypothetical protein AJ78_07393 [Emergomyces pasteurianus Ep9510]